MIIRGIDSDNFDGSVPATHYRRLHDEAAVRFNIIGLEAQMPFVEDQKLASDLGGLFVPFGYKFLYWQPTDLERMKQATAAQLPIAVDCEHPSNWEPGRVVDRIHQAKELLLQEGLYWGIYSGFPWWQEHTNDNRDFAGDRWWHASYPFGGTAPTNLPPIDYPMSRLVGDKAPQGLQLPYASMPGIPSYAGKSACDVWQYANTCYLDNLGDWDFDMSVMVVPDAPAPPPPGQLAPHATSITLRFSEPVSIQPDPQGLTEWWLDIVPPQGGPQ